MCDVVCQVGDKCCAYIHLSTPQRQHQQSFLAALKAFGKHRGPQAELTLAETMQLVNLRPTAPVEVHLVSVCASMCGRD